MAELYSVTLVWYHVFCVEDTAVPTLSDGDTGQNRTSLYQNEEECTVTVNKLLQLVRTADKK